MIKFGLGIALLLFAVCIILFGCFSPYTGGNEGLIIINLGGSEINNNISSAAYTGTGFERAGLWPPQDYGILNQIEHRIKLTGNSTISLTANGGSTVRVNVSPGLWNISIEAFYNGVLYAAGSDGVDVKAGQPNPVTINMTQSDNLFLLVSNLTEWNTACTTITGSPAQNYVINITDNFNIPSTGTNTFGTAANITLTSSGNRILTLSNNGSLLIISGNQTVTIQNLELKGHISNNAALIQVNNNGKLVLRSGARISGNTYTTSTTVTGGAGINVNNGTLEIAGGEVSDNIVNGSVTNIGGGGIFAANNSTLLMTSGAIRGNSISNNSSGSTASRGGGIYMVNSGYFEMTGGIIENNSVTTTSTTASSHSHGGGVAFYTGISFDLKGGTIRNNTCHAIAGDNFGSSAGGGVFFNGNDFIMSGGIISGNRTTHSVDPNKSYGIGDRFIDGAYGGGIYLDFAGSTVKNGGIIYGSEVSGNDASGIPLRNRAQSDGSGLGGGHAVFYNTDLEMVLKHWRNSTAYANNNMYSDTPGSGGGWD